MGGIWEGRGRSLRRDADHDGGMTEQRLRLSREHCEIWKGIWAKARIYFEDTFLLVEAPEHPCSCSGLHTSSRTFCSPSTAFSYCSEHNNHNHHFAVWPPPAPIDEHPPSRAATMQTVIYREQYSQHLNTPPLTQSIPFHAHI